MEVTFTCPYCGEGTLVGEEFVGQSGECRSCGLVVTVPKLVSLNSGSGASSFDGSATTPQSGFGWKSIAWICAVVIGLFALTFFISVEPGRDFTRRISSGNNLKQIALAMQNYHDTFGQFPRPFWRTEDGQRTLSWRVAIAPFTEHRTIPWRYEASAGLNNEVNKSAAECVEPIYQQPGLPRDGTFDTFYMVITGPGTMFEEGKDFAMRDILDGTSNTIMVVEVKNSGVHWIEPSDLDIRTMIMQVNAEDSNSISSPWKNGAQVVMADGTVKFLSNKTLESTLRAMITRSGGETFRMP